MMELLAIKERAWNEINSIKATDPNITVENLRDKVMVKLKEEFVMSYEVVEVIELYVLELINTKKDSENKTESLTLDHCTRCGKHVAELKPFGKEGDPVNGNFEGIKLVKFFRELQLVDKHPLLDKILGEYENLGKEAVLETYGEELLETAFKYEALLGNTVKGFECSDCVLEDGPFEYREQNIN